MLDDPLVISKNPGQAVVKGLEKREHQNGNSNAEEDRKMTVILSSANLVHSDAISNKTTGSEGYPSWDHRGEILYLHDHYLSCSRADAEIPREHEANIQIPPS